MSPETEPLSEKVTVTQEDGGSLYTFQQVARVAPFISWNAPNGLVKLVQAEVGQT